jgi:hypothetical protein
MKNLYSSHRKKIRGWKRHKRKIDRWCQKSMELDLDYLRQHQRDYVKIWIHPFYSLQRINPPIWYQRIVLESMIDIYLHWYHCMKIENEPFYLKIWLFIPDFISSQIVVAYRDYVSYYDSTFVRKESKKSFPHEWFSPIREKLNLFDWEAHNDTIVYFHNDLAEDIELGLRSEEEVERMIMKADLCQTIQINNQDDVMYSHHVGDVWVGTLKQT